MHKALGSIASIEVLFTPTVSTLRGQKQEDQEFRVILWYVMILRPA